MSKVIRLNDRLENLIEEYRQDLILKNESSNIPSKEQIIIMLENMTEQEVVTAINESKKAVAKKTKKGVRVKQSLKG